MRTAEVVLARGIRAGVRGLVIVLDDREVTVPWEKCGPLVARASDEDRRRAELSPGGYGVRWPLLDEDLSVGGLVTRVEGKN